MWAMTLSRSMAGRCGSAPGGFVNATVIGANVPQPSTSSNACRAVRSRYVGAKRLALMRRPVRLVGSANVATSFGSGMLGSGCASVSNTTVAPGPVGVARSPSGIVSIEQAKAKTRATREGYFISISEVRTASPRAPGRAMARSSSRPPRRRRRRRGRARRPRRRAGCGATARGASGLDAAVELDAEVVPARVAAAVVHVRALRRDAVRVDEVGGRLPRSPRRP